MSDNMERERNERLNARKIEEEEMKRELTGIGIYEPGFTYNQMKEILGFLNESEDTSNAVAFNNRNTQKGAQYTDNECLSETRSDANMAQELSRPSYKTNRTSPTMHSERKTVRYSSSPEVSPLFEVRNPMCRRKSSDSDELVEKQLVETTNSTTHSTNRFYSSKSGNCSQTAAIPERKTGQAVQDEVVQKLERWQLNPLDMCADEKDVPLRQPCRALVRERAPFGSCNEASASEQRSDQVARALSQRLKETAELWYTWHPPADSEFQWGSPIQVGTANGSLDRKPLTESKTEQIKAECIYRDSYERISKRKASSLIANLSKESSSENESENESDDNIFDIRKKKKKKKKTQSNSKLSNVTITYQRANHEKTTLNVVASQEQSHNDNNNDASLEDGHVESSHSKKKDDEKNDRSLSPELTTYPRRIIPPTPKTRLSLKQRKRNITPKSSSSKVRRIDGNKDVEQATKEQKKNNNTISNDDIRRTLEEWNSEEEKEVATSKDVEIRPLPITKEVRSRLSKKRLLGNNTEVTRETRPMTREREANRERDKEKWLRVHEEEKNQEKLSRIDNKNGSWEHQLLSDDENDSPEMKQESDVQSNKQSANISLSSNNVRCPICNKLFSPNEIEGHAADCEQFEENEEEDNEQHQFECNMCNSYKTSNSVDYEQHVHQCIHKKNDKTHSLESKTDSTDSASSSFFTNYKPISEQKDSEIDYLGQFPSDSKTKMHNTGKKRKR